MTKTKSDKKMIGEEQGATGMIVNLWRIRAAMTVVIAVPFIILGIYVQNWALVAVWAILGIAAAVTSRAITRKTRRRMRLND